MEHRAIRSGSRQVCCVVLAIVCMAVGGCASRKAFRRGTEMQEAGRYDEAVSHFEEAVRLKPKREKYAVALAEAREQAAQYHLSEAKTHLTSRDLVTAQSEIDMALGYSADDASARALRKQVPGEVSRAESLMADARRLGSLREWDRALALGDENIEHVMAAMKEWVPQPFVGWTTVRKLLEQERLILQTQLKHTSEKEAQEVLKKKIEDLGKRDIGP